MIYAGLMIYLGASSLVFIELLGVPVHWYGLTYLAGLAFAWWMAVRRSD